MGAEWAKAAMEFMAKESESEEKMNDCAVTIRTTKIMGGIN